MARNLRAGSSVNRRRKAAIAGFANFGLNPKSSAQALAVTRTATMLPIGPLGSVGFAGRLARKPRMVGAGLIVRLERMFDELDRAAPNESNPTGRSFPR